MRPTVAYVYTYTSECACIFFIQQMLNFICVHVSGPRFVNSAAEIMLSCPPYVLRHQQITAVHAWPIVNTITTTDGQSLF